MSKLRKIEIAYWTAWALAFVPLGVAIANKNDMTFFLSMVGLMVALDIALVGSLFLMDRRIK